MRHFSKSHKAITLVETVVYMGVFSLIMTAIASLSLLMYKSSDFALSSSFATAEARRALFVAVKTIRKASFADNGAYPVVSMEPYEFVFYSDTDNDGKIEKVRLFADNGSFKMGITKSQGLPPQYLPENETVKTVSNFTVNEQKASPIFVYLDSDLQVIDDPSRILDLKAVRFEILIDKDPNRPPSPYKFSNSITLRNITNAYDKW